MTVKNPKIDSFLHQATRWREEMQALRDILLDCGLTEELKWGKPCYTAHGGNIVIMQPFKAHLSLMFFKGALLDDHEGLLRSQGEDTQAALRMEFSSAEQVSRRASRSRRRRSRTMRFPPSSRSVSARTGRIERLLKR
jgi:uncharacterized protein YdeI (YjbR/CyaY-like superfamily)